MSRSSIAVGKAISGGLTLMLLVGAARTAQAQLFVGADAGVGVMSQADSATPICCGEDATWSALGGRVGARLDYRSAGWFFVRAYAGLAVYDVKPNGVTNLTMISPDMAFMLGAQTRREKVTAEFALGAGRRGFFGTTTSNDPLYSGIKIETSEDDLRLSVGIQRALGGGHGLGGEVTVAKGLVARDVVMLSLVYTWAVLG